MPLTHQTAFVTGASRGIGREACIALAGAGTRVIVTARQRHDAEETARLITDSGGQALALCCDVTDHASVQAALKQACDAFGPINILVSNAGSIQPIAHLVDTPVTEWLGTVETNLIGAFYCMHAVLPMMVEQGAGVIIHLSSGAAHRPLEGWSAYCASKAGLAMLTRSVHEEYGAAGIRAMGLIPGVVDTDMQAEIRLSGLNPVSQIKREMLSPALEPGRAIAFLCTSAGQVYAGREVDIRDAEFRRVAGLPA
jgi:NAD(P)-dependent dehydrogenase (short-subunit alcohol dehydrogenase family)